MILKVNSNKQLSGILEISLLNFLIIMVIITIIIGIQTSPVLALEEPEGKLVLSAGTLQGIAPQGRMMLRGENIGFSGSFAWLPYTSNDSSGRLNLWQFSGRIYSPISYRDTDFYLAGGFSRAAHNIENQQISGIGYQAKLGFERDIRNRISWGGEIGYLHHPSARLDSKILAGITINYSLPIKSREREEITFNHRNREEDTAETDNYNVVEIVKAEGTIDKVNLPFQLSGTWSFTADFEENTANLSVSGDSQDGSFRYSFSGEPERRGNNISFTTSRTDTHQDKEVDFNIRVRVNPRSLSVRVTGQREDGVEMSGNISGTTTSFDN